MAKLHKIRGCRAATRKADILFIHGLGGHPLTTWRYGKNAATSWPHRLSKEFPDIAVWSLGYPASPTRLARIGNWRIFRHFLGGTPDSGHTMPLPDRARQVLDLMVQQGFGKAPILLVCHSLGGLLAKQILRNAAEATDSDKVAIFTCTQAVFFIATPHTGAELASLANAFRVVCGTTISIEELRAHDAHLRDLFDWYRNHATKAGIRTATVYEQRNLNGVRIVNPTSAHPGTGDDPIALDEDHVSICKPRSVDHQACGVLRRLIQHVVSPPPTPPPSTIPRPAQSAATVTEPMSSVQAFQQDVVSTEPVFSQSNTAAHATNIVQIGRVVSMQVLADRSPEIQTLQEQLSTKDKQIDQKDLQIASLQRLVETLVGESARTSRGETTQGSATGRVPDEAPTTIGPGPDAVYEERAADWIRLLDELLELDFQRASEAAAKLEPWIESRASKLSNSSKARLYQYISRVEITKVRRSLPGADPAKAACLLKKADDALR